MNHLKIIAGSPQIIQFEPKVIPHNLPVGPALRISESVTKSKMIIEDILTLAELNF